MKDPLQPCKTCNIPHDFHPDIKFYCAESHDLKRQLAHALRDRDRAIALLSKHLRYHNRRGGERGYVRLFMGDDGQLKPMGHVCYESEVMVAFHEKVIP